MRNFIIISQTVFDLQSGHEYMVEMAMFYGQRTITPKVGKPELQFIFSARRRIMLYIFVKFRETISDGIRVMERIGMTEAMADGRTLKTLKGIT